MLVHRIHALLAAVLALLVAATAHADGIALVTRELGAWNDALAALREDLGSEGRRVHVGVRAGGERVACDGYRLELDAAAAAAFRIGGCDPGTGETLLVLEHRGALFDHGFHVPRPRTISISAVLRATAVGSGGPRGGSVVQCSWVVRPYLDDVERGTRVMLTPEHYDLRSASAFVQPLADRGGWSLGAPRSAVFQIEYEVTDRATGEVVLRQKMSLPCVDAAPPELAPPFRAAAPASPPPEMPAPKAAPERSDCKWGTKGSRCKGSPLPMAVMYSVMSSGWAGLASYAFYEAAIHPGSRGSAIFGGSITSFLALGEAGASALYWYPFTHPAGVVRARPSVSLSRQGATLGLTGTF